MLVVVVDINGVLGDVRKLRSAVAGRTPDAFLCSSNQVFYWRPGAHEFLKRIKAIPEVCLVLWTSRLRKNAAPIEAQIRDLPGMQFHAMLHGEDCHARDRSGFHPIKDVRTLRRYYAEVGSAIIAFVDDKPQFVATDVGSFVLSCATYDASAAATEKEDSIRVFDRLASELEDVARAISAKPRCNSSTATAQTASACSPDRVRRYCYH